MCLLALLAKVPTVDGRSTPEVPVINTNDWQGRVLWLASRVAIGTTAPRDTRAAP